MTNDLLQAILDDPDNDELRLVYSDWLEENGQIDRANFIRIQIELSKDLINQKLLKQEGVLAEKYIYDCGEWNLEFLPKVFGDNWLQLIVFWEWYWAKGFVEDIKCSVYNWIEFGPKWVKYQPIKNVNIERYLTLFRLPLGYVYSRDSLSDYPKFRKELFDIIKYDYKYDTLTDNDVMYYKTKEAATAALSFGLVKWAKNQTVE